MRNNLILIISGILLLCISVIAQEKPPINELKTGQWIQNWLLCGPFQLKVETAFPAETEHLPGFDTDFLKAHGGEANPKIKAGQIEKYRGDKIKWIEYSAPDSMINLDHIISQKSFVTAYSYAEIVSPHDKIYMLSLGTNDGGTLWVNGEKVWDFVAGRRLVPDDDLIPVFLNKRKNTLLLKIEERGNFWGFCARFFPFSEKSFVRKTQFFQVISTENGAVFLKSPLSNRVSNQLFKNLNVKITLQDAPEWIIWQGEWLKVQKMPLAIPPDQFGHYNLFLEGKLTDDEKFSQQIPFKGGKRIEHVLFNAGKTDYRIVIDSKASESEKWAAKELQYWLAEISGADFFIQTGIQSLNDKEIIIGFNERTQALLGGQVKAPEITDESFTYQNIGPTILIWGGKQRGTMYGVMTFLEKELGCRWYTPKVNVIPEKPKYSFDYLYHTEAPQIRVRNDFYFEAFEPVWAARNKINGAMNYRQQPGGVECYWSVHTFYPLMPPSEFYDKHPEYYSLIDGKRIHEHAQLCLTNPDVLKIMTERVKKTIREKPEYLIYSVSQNDWGNPCQCERCQAIVKQEESESGPLIWFVNQIAERIESEFPDKYIGTLAYQYTRKPSKTLKPRQNVVIRLCSIECCFAHDFKSCPENASFLVDLKGWAAISPQLYIWDYVVNFSHYIMPYPNFKVLQSNIQTFRENKTIGIMEQAAYQSRGGEFAELRAFVLAKLLWNPEENTEKIINDFMYGFYGRTGQHIRRYFDLLHQQITPHTHIHLGLAPDDLIFSDDFIRQADAIFDQAEVVAENEALRQRVEMARLPLMYLKCQRTPLQARYDGTYQRFKTIVAREGITHYAESGEPQRNDFHRKVENAQQ